MTVPGQPLWGTGDFTASRIPTGRAKHDARIQLFRTMGSVVAYMLMRTAPEAINCGAVVFEHIAVPIMTLSAAGSLGFLNTVYLKNQFCDDVRVFEDRHCRIFNLRLGANVATRLAWR
jgi:hypothetical protein